MPQETRLLGYGIGARMALHPRPDPEVPGAQATDERGEPIYDPVLEFMFQDFVSKDTFVIPLNETGVEAMKQALGIANFSPVLVPAKPTIVLP